MILGEAMLEAKYVIGILISAFGVMAAVVKVLYDRNQKQYDKEAAAQERRIERLHNKMDQLQDEKDELERKNLELAIELASHKGQPKQ